MKVTIYTDGSARGNPDGPGGYGVILRYIDPKGVLHERLKSAGYKKTTNNRMELFAAISALGALKEPCNVRLYSDSNYLVQAFNDHWIENWKKNGWKTSNGTKVENQDLWFILSAQTQKHHVEFIKVKGHADHPENNRCDELARESVRELMEMEARAAAANAEQSGRSL